MELTFLETETKMESNFNQKFSTPNKCCCHREPVADFEKSSSENKSKMRRLTFYEHRTTIFLIYMSFGKCLRRFSCTRHWQWKIPLYFEEKMFAASRDFSTRDWINSDQEVYIVCAFQARRRSVADFIESSQMSDELWYFPENKQVFRNECSRIFR